MSTTQLLLSAGACIALGIGALLLLLARRWSVFRWLPGDTGVRLPPWMRAAMPVAILIEPVVEPLLTTRRRQQVTRELEAMGVAHVLTALRFESLGASLALGILCSLLLVSVPVQLALAAGSLGVLAGHRWLARQREARQQAIARELPAWLDLMTVAVEAGSTLAAGLRLAVERAPQSPLRDYFERVLREIRGGRPRAQAFSYVAGLYGNEALSAVAGALEHAESSGMSLGQVLRAQAQQRTAERFARAEKLAMQAPVKMLGPLILCIFPCTFIVIGVPIAVRLREALGA